MLSNLAKIEKKVTRSGYVLTAMILVSIYEAYAVLYIVIEILEHKMAMSTGVAGALFHLTLLIAAAAFTRNRQMHRKNLIELGNEQAILTFAQSERGRPMTTTEIALGAQLSAADTIKTLRRLGSHGMCEQQLNRASEEVYSFIAFQRQPDHPLDLPPAEPNE